MSDLSQLIERLEALTSPDAGVDLAIGAWLWDQSHMPWDCYDYKFGGDGAIPFTVSLEAAVALVERVLPGWRWIVDGDGNATLLPGRLPGEPVEHVHASTPAIALVLALLRAKAQGEARDPTEGSR